MGDSPVADFRFLHTADIHLDSPLHGLSRYEGLPVDEIRGATRAAFDNLVQCAVDAAVDFVLIAGDLFDGDWRDMSTGLYFARAMGRLDQASIPVFLLSGNHDAASVVTRTIPWPPNVRQFGSRRAETHTLPDLGVAIHGQSFSTPAVTENLVLAYPMRLSPDHSLASCFRGGFSAESMAIMVRGFAATDFHSRPGSEHNRTDRVEEARAGAS